MVQLMPIPKTNALRLMPSESNGNVSTSTFLGSKDPQDHPDHLARQEKMVKATVHLTTTVRKSSLAHLDLPVLLDQLDPKDQLGLPELLD